MAAEAPPPLHQSFRGALDATTDLDDDRLGTTVFPQGFAETARTHFHTLHERKTSTISFDDVEGDIGDIRSVEDAFVLFGLKPDDRTSRREQIKMWKHIERAITAEKRRIRRRFVEEVRLYGRGEKYMREALFYATKYGPTDSVADRKRLEAEELWQKLIKVSILTEDEIAWLNAYHARVLELVGPRAEGDVKRWLEANTAKIE